MQPQTHQQICSKYVGQVIELDQGYARVQLRTNEDMECDEYHLIHGGFTFGLADYAAMLAVNHPNVVLGKAEVKFLAPSVLGDTLEAEARVRETSGKKSVVEVIVKTEKPVFEGVFTCFSLEHHVLKQ